MYKLKKRSFNMTVAILSMLSIKSIRNSSQKLLTDLVVYNGTPEGMK